MKDHGVTYEIEILDVEFSEEGFISDKTVIVRKFRSNKKVSTSRFGLRDTEAIYKDIQEGKAIHLNCAYVKNFSLTEYRKIYNLAEQDVVTLHNFTARNAFFEAHAETDFSFGRFETEVADFTGARFSQGNISFYKADFKIGKTDFTDVDFGAGDVNFQFAAFDKGDIIFEKAVFSGGNVSFVNTQFGNGYVDFKNVDFGTGDTSFFYSKFGEGDKTFERARFRAPLVDFRKTEFGNGKVDFRLTDFGKGALTFEESEFGSGRISFRRAEFGEGTVSFEMVDFGTGGTSFARAHFGSGKLKFRNCIFDTLNLNGTQLNGYADFRISRGEVLDLSDTIVRDVLDFQPIDTKVDLKILNISGMRCLGQIFIDWDKNNVFGLIASQPNTSLRDKSIQFHLLKEALHNNGQYSQEDLAYVAFKRYESKGQREEIMQKSKWNALWFYPSYFGQWLVFDKAGLFATNPLRVLTSMLVVYLAFSLTYLFLPDLLNAGVACSGPDVEHLSELVKALYFSAITFTTIGYGDCLPFGVMRLLAGAEGWIGIFLMSYFTVAFVRRILR